MRLFKFTHRPSFISIFVSTIMSVVTPAVANEIVRVSAGLGNGPPSIGSNYASISSNGECVVFTSRQELEGCYSQGARSSVFLYQRKANRLSFASLVNGAEHGLASDGAAISDNCSHMAFRLQEVSGSPPTPGQVYWRENTLVELNSTTPNNTLFVDYKLCGETLEPGQTKEYIVDSPGELNLTSSSGEVGLTVTSSNDDQIICTSNDPLTQADKCVLKDISGNVKVKVSSSGNSTAIYELFLDGETDEGYASVQNGAFAAGNTPSTFGIDISNDGRFVVFETSEDNLSTDDVNGDFDIYLHDTVLSTTELISTDTNGQAASGGSRFPTISANGKHVAFVSASTEIIPSLEIAGQKIFVHSNESSPEFRIASLSDNGDLANSVSREADISSDGRFVAFRTQSENLVDLNGDGIYDDFAFGFRSSRYRIYVHDSLTRTTELISVGNDGDDGSNHSFYPSISADGRYVAFMTTNNLLEKDTNGVADIYIRDRQTKHTVLASVSESEEIANGASNFPRISSDGTWVAFESDATNLTPDDTNSISDIFIRQVSSLFDNLETDTAHSNENTLIEDNGTQNDSQTMNDGADGEEIIEDSGSNSLSTESGGGLFSLLELFIITALAILGTFKRWYRTHKPANSKQ